MYLPQYPIALLQLKDNIEMDCESGYYFYRPKAEKVLYIEYLFDIVINIKTDSTTLKSFLIIEYS